MGSTGSERSCRVLLVEGSRTDAELVEALLSHGEGVRFDITVAQTLADALAWLSRRSPDVVLLDLNLPDGEGLEPYRAVRNRSPRVPVVVTTARHERGLGQSAVQQGAQDFLTKGRITGDRLADTLLFAIERARRADSQFLRDPLTGLAMTPLFGEKVAEALSRAEREKRYVAVLVLGLGNFGNVDAWFGPSAGEELLFGVAERLCEAFPPPSALARVGVDEFAILVEGLARPSNAERAGQRVLGTLAPEFKLGAAKLRVTACIGIALARSEADGPALLDRSRAAMVEQRRSGGQGIRLA